jgi:hypothetical protein
VKPKFQADADLNEDIVKRILRREPGIDFQTSTSAGLRGLRDWVVLELAATEGRIVVSHDRRTMPEVFAKFLGNSSSPGLFLISQKTDLLIAIESIVLAGIASEHEEWVDRVVAVPF